MIRELWKLPHVLHAAFFCAMISQANSFLPGMEMLQNVPNMMMNKTNSFVQGFMKMAPTQKIDDPKKEEGPAEESTEDFPGSTLPLNAEPTKGRKKRQLSFKCDERDRIAEKAMLNSLLEMRHRDPMDLGSALMGNLEEGRMKGLRTLANVSDIRVGCDRTSTTLLTTLRIDRLKITYVWLWNVLLERVGQAWMSGKQVKLTLTALVDKTKKPPYIVLSNTLMNPIEDFEVGYSGLEPFGPPLEIVAKSLYENFKHSTMELFDETLLNVYAEQYARLKTAAGQEF